MHTNMNRRLSQPRIVPFRSALYTYLALLVSICIVIVRRVHRHYICASLIHGTSRHLGLKALPSIHFFTSPKPFVGADRDPQIRAINSWLQLNPRPLITLLGNGAGYAQVCSKFHLQHERNIDQTFLQVPMLNSMLHVVNSSSADIVVFLNADILLFDDFLFAVRKLQTELSPGWLGIAARWDVSSTPYRANSLLRRSFRQHAVKQARTTGTLHTYGGVDLWVWDTSSGPLLQGPIPRFIFGRGRYDNWLTHETIAQKRRSVVDLSEAVTLVHVTHNYNLVKGVRTTDDLFWSNGAREKFETFINSYLSSSHGSFEQQMGTTLHAPLKLATCYESNGICLFRRVRPASCRCEHSSFVPSTLNDPFIVNHSRTIFCGLLSKNYGSKHRDRFIISGSIDEGHEPAVFGLPLTQKQLLQVVSSTTGADLVFLVVGDFAERLLISELACSMRAVGVFPWLVIVALDDDLYRYCITRGLPVYLSDFDNTTGSDYDTFKELVRYQVMYELLQMKREVLSLEPAVVFRGSPWKYFKAHLQAIDVAILPWLPELAQLAEDRSFVSTAVIFARPNIRALHLLRAVMAILEHEPQNSGSVLMKLSCGTRNQALSTKNLCKHGKGALVHLLSSDYFRPMEAGSCPRCSTGTEPLVLYVGSFSYERSAELAIGVLGHRGVRAFDIDGDFCSYDYRVRVQRE
ncbi:glycosyltransferase-like protein [Gracilaria domingensis]|nr:glycosyltransferase-like protein [Gracilaria domingensis]